MLMLNKISESESNSGDKSNNNIRQTCVYYYVKRCN